MGRTLHPLPYPHRGVHATPHPSRHRGQGYTLPGPLGSGGTMKTMHVLPETGGDRACEEC